VLAEIATQVGATRNQVVLAWLLRQGISPLVGISRVEHLDEAIDAQDLVLTDAHMAAFAAAR
jgi:aryl-alcohol dehydrogenase-like predicted oxidoreductase